jgi:hypothetical protein
MPDDRRIEARGVSGEFRSPAGFQVWSDNVPNRERINQQGI